MMIRPYSFAAAAVAAFAPVLKAQQQEPPAVSPPVAAGAPAAEATAAGDRTPVLEPEIIQQIRYEGLENSKVMGFLDQLTNTIGPRLTGSHNFTLACEWAKQQFEDMGLEVELEKWDTWPVQWDRGQWQGRVVEPVSMELHVATEAWTAGTPGRVRAKLIEAPIDADELDAVKDSIEGAWLLRTGRRAFPGLTEFIEEHPIAGWVTSSRGDAKYPNRIRVFGSRPRSDRVPTTPSVVVRADQFDELVGLVEKGDVVIEFDIRNRWTKRPIDLYNVVAELRGSEKPDEVVVVCGHLDSWHQATGTTDNGTGTTSTLEAARILTAAGARPKRTIRFCLWGGEEQGLLGSRAHVQQRRTSMKNISAVFNHDTGTNWAQSLTVNSANEAAMRRVLAPVMEMTAPDQDWEGPVFELRASDNARGGGGSDHASFLAARVPAFPWGLKGRVDYFGYTWHSQWDTFDVAVPEYQRHTSTVIALTALGVADLPEKLSNEGIQVRRNNRSISLPDAMGSTFGAKFGGDGDLVVTEIKADGRAAKLGLKEGDRIVGLGEEEVGSLTDLRLAMRGLGRDPGTVKLSVRRGEETVVLDVERTELRTRRPGRRRRDG